MKKNNGFIKGCVITPPCGRANIHPLSNVLKICNEIFGGIKLVLTYGDQGDDFNTFVKNDSYPEVYLIKYKANHIFTKILYYTVAQFKVLYYIIKHSNGVSIYFFYLADTLILPMIAVKLLGRKAIIIIGSNVNREMALKKDYYIDIFNSKLIISIYVRH